MCEVHGISIKRSAYHCIGAVLMNRSTNMWCAVRRRGGPLQGSLMWRWDMRLFEKDPPGTYGVRANASVQVPLSLLSPLWSGCTGCHLHRVWRCLLKSCLIVCA